MTRFRTTIRVDGRNTGIEVPEEVVLGFGRGRRVPVVVTLGGHSYRSTVSFYKGAFMISLSAENRAAAGVEGGQEVEVELDVDDAPRTVEVPADLAEALAAAGLRAAFDALSFTAQKAHATAVESAKAAETRSRRIVGIVEQLRG